MKYSSKIINKKYNLAFNNNIQNKYNMFIF